MFESSVISTCSVALAASGSNTSSEISWGAARWMNRADRAATASEILPVMTNAHSIQFVDFFLGLFLNQGELLGGDLQGEHHLPLGFLAPLVLAVTINAGDKQHC